MFVFKHVQFFERNFSSIHKLNKMISCGFVDISNFSIYETKDTSMFSLLSRFFLEVYLSDLDRFLFQKLITYNSYKSVYSFRKKSFFTLKNCVGRVFNK